MKQTYQELTKEVIKELPLLSNYDPQQFFWIMKLYEPKRFERMTFDTNSWKPYSSTLVTILSDLVICGMYKRPFGYIPFNKNLIRSIKIKHIKNNIK